MFNAGELIGKYKIVRQLGSGGMGTVYLAWDESLGREVAIKIIRAERQEAENAYARFKLEAKMVAQLNHPNIVQIYEFSPQADIPFIVMEYVAGLTLAQAIENRVPFALNKVLAIASQCLSGLAAAHEIGIIHRDIKPANILLADNGMVKLTDFGLARSIDIESGLTVSGTIAGTLHYLAPEIARGEKAGKQSDIYSLGITIYEMLSGNVPLHDDSPLKLIGMIAQLSGSEILQGLPEIPAPISVWLQKMLAGEPASRYKSAHPALVDLKKLEPSSPAIDAASGTALTEEVIIQKSGAERVPAKAKKEKVRVAKEDVDSIIFKAMRLEKSGRDVLDEESLLEIAAEIGVGAEAVKEAIAAHKKAQTQKEQRLKVAKYISTAIVAILLIISIVWLFLRKPERKKTAYQLTGGQRGTLTVSESPVEKAAVLKIGSAWTSANLNYNSEKQILLVTLSLGQSVQCRAGKGKVITITDYYYGELKSQGEIVFRATKEPVQVRAAVVERLKMAAISFTGGKEGTELGDFALGIGDVIATRLAETKSFTMLERVQVEKVTANLKLESTEFFDQATAGRIGKMLGVDFLITGSVQKVAQKYRLSAKRLNAQTGKALESVVLDGSESEIFVLQDRLATKLAQAIYLAEIQKILHLPVP